MANNYNDSNYEKLAIKHNLPVKVIKAIIESQFETIRETIKQYSKEDSTTHKSIRIPHLGLITPRSK